MTDERTVSFLRQFFAQQTFRQQAMKLLQGQFRMLLLR